MPYAPISPFTKERQSRSDKWRGSASARGYDRTWAFIRKAFLAQHPCCGDRPNHLPPVMSQCHERGLVVPATQVDHVVPHKGNTKLFHDLENNGQSLCASCGARKSKAGL